MGVMVSCLCSSRRLKAPYSDPGSGSGVTFFRRNDDALRWRGLGRRFVAPRLAMPVPAGAAGQQ